MDRESRNKEAGGIYVFEEKQDAEKYAEMHKNRLEAAGVKDIRVKILTSMKS